ncbi:MAG: hypothetical protein JWO30_2084 [Fibrobacteres bacterium]|nr:hypothetical protein [Fibrobacterota bacterium]
MGATVAKALKPASENGAGSARIAGCVPALCAGVLALLAGLAVAAPGADTPAAWEKSPGIPVESDFFRDRLDQPQNHFLLNGQEGFVSGREFYQLYGDATPFLWATHPFLRYGTDRSWQNDTVDFAYRSVGSNEIGAGASSPFVSAEASWLAVEGLRLHGGLDQNGLYSQRTLPARRAQALPDKDNDLAWFGGDMPMKSQANIGSSFERRGSTLAAQYNQGWWWTTSPVSGLIYPWEGFNADLVYKAGEDFDLTLVEQQWDSPSPVQFYKSHWRRSEINMSFLGASEGSWLWRFDIGYERRAMTSQGAFEEFEDKGYPTRFRYRQDWSAPDSLPFRMLSQGSLAYRDGMFIAQHSSEFREPFGAHQPMQFLRAYYRHPFKGYVVPTENLTPDDSLAIGVHPGTNARGLVGGAEYREVRQRFLAGIGGNYSMEWELPLFEAVDQTEVNDIIVRQGRYEASQYLLQNATGKVFASGGIGENANWRFQAGVREFWGHDADLMEFLPSPWWAGGGAGWGFPGKTRLDAQVTYLGPKEVRGWGPVFKVPTHWENQISLVQPLFSNRLKLSLAGLHAFGEDIQEQPNGNPVRFRILAGIEGTIY